METRKVSFVPGLYKIFDEILVNAADNKQRDPTMKLIKVVVDREKGEISVENDGQGIPVQIHDVSLTPTCWLHSLLIDPYRKKESIFLK